ncbi:phage portal protein [Brevundimonas sp.]|uniref:phage portal protein n=1 Tax=Brevundimonas sp. TaxID=1871086 RepID=UPI002D5CA222|nr:phage portal protein [Brevundimonas sp.]HYD29201.1 phage portal protein [Brevundimonas sp.]
MRKPVPLNWIDRAIAYVSPAAGVERLRARTVFAVAGGYQGAKRSRTATQGWAPGGGSPNADTLPDLEELRARSRDLDRNAPLAAGALNTYDTNVVGTGLRARPSIDRAFLGLSEAEADRWEQDAARIFETWAGSRECDLTRTSTFYETQSLALRSALSSGDVFAAERFLERPGSPFGLKVQLIEADRVCNPSRRVDTATLAGGVEFDENGAPVAYHVTDRHPGERGAHGLKWARVPVFAPTSGRRNVHHVFLRLRPDLARGVPFLAPVIEHFKQLSKYSEAEIMAAVVNACFAVGVKTEDGTGASSLEQKAAGAGGAGASNIAVTEAGLIFDLLPNEQIQSFTPGRPSAAFDPFVQAILRQIGVALELPFEVVIKHFTASYSASRAALEMAWQAFRRRRVWLAAGYCQPFYESLLTEAIARGWLDAPGFFADPFVRAAYCGCEWIGDAPISLDPVKDATAAEKWAALGVKTLSQITAATTGGDWERNLPQRAKEERLRRAAGLGAPAPAAAAPPAAPADEDEDEAKDEEEQGNG